MTGDRWAALVSVAPFAFIVGMAIISVIADTLHAISRGWKDWRDE